MLFSTGAQSQRKMVTWRTRKTHTMDDQKLPRPKSAGAIYLRRPACLFILAALSRRSFEANVSGSMTTAPREAMAMIKATLG